MDWISLLVVSSGLGRARNANQAQPSQEKLQITQSRHPSLSRLPSPPLPAPNQAVSPSSVIPARFFLMGTLGFACPQPPAQLQLPFLPAFHLVYKFLTHRRKTRPNTTLACLSFSPLPIYKPLISKRFRLEFLPFALRLKDIYLASKFQGRPSPI